MTFFESNIDKFKTGFNGEEIIRQIFIKKKIPFMQIDVMFKYNNKWCLGEIKTQEKYLSPPFNGHGLPNWQIKRRIEFEEDTGIKSYLIIYDLEEKCIYMQLMSKLMQGKYHQTNGNKPRIIFPIESFNKFELNIKE